MTIKIIKIDKIRIVRENKEVIDVLYSIDGDTHRVNFPVDAKEEEIVDVLRRIAENKKQEKKRKEEEAEKNKNQKNLEKIQKNLSDKIIK